MVRNTEAKVLLKEKIEAPYKPTCTHSFLEDLRKQARIDAVV